MGVQTLPPAPRGVLLANVAVGLLVTGLYFLVALRFTPFTARTPDLVVYLIFGSLPLFALLWAWLLESAIPRTGLLLGCASAFSASCCALILASLATKPGSISVVAIYGLWLIVFGTGLYTGFAGMLRLVRKLSGGVREQNGMYCWGCDYTRTGVRDERCPECATQWDLGHPVGWAWRRLPAFGAVCRSAPVMLAIALVVSGVWLFPRAREKLRSEAFVARMIADGAEPALAPATSIPTNFRARGDQPSMVLPLARDSSTCLLVTYDVTAGSTRPAMLLRAVVRATGGSAPPGMVLSFVPEVYTELDVRQAHRVIEGGVPLELQIKFRQRLMDAERDEDIRRGRPGKVDPSPFFEAEDRGR
jgi:hypothetical protein